MNEKSGCFVDTNVLIYSLDSRSPAKRQLARQWILGLAAKNELLVSPKVLDEVLAASRKARAAITLEEAELLVTMAEPWCRLNSSYLTTTAALSLHRATGYQVHDCVLLATAYLGGCAWFLSEDMHHQRVIGGMTIINPFVITPDSFFAGR